MPISVSPQSLGTSARAQIAQQIAGEIIAKAKRPSKYRAVKTTLNGHTFDSKAEAAEYARLKLRERAGEITELRLQVPFVCKVNGLKVCTWIADFVYLMDGEEVILDVKGMRTPVYKIKKKLVEACFPGTRIVEIAA